MDGGNLFIISRLLFPCYIFFMSNKFINFELETSQVSPTLCYTQAGSVVMFLIFNQYKINLSK